MNTNLTDVSASNGMAWSPDWTKMYYIDTFVKKIYSFDYDESAGRISNQTVAVDYTQHDFFGLPDGMTIDRVPKNCITVSHASSTCNAAMQC